MLSTFPSTIGKLCVSSGRGILTQWDVLVLWQDNVCVKHSYNLAVIQTRLLKCMCVNGELALICKIHQMVSIPYSESTRFDKEINLTIFPILIVRMFNLWNWCCDCNQLYVRLKKPNVNTDKNLFFFLIIYLSSSCLEHTRHIRAVRVTNYLCWGQKKMIFNPKQTHLIVDLQNILSITIAIPALVNQMWK